MTPRAWRYAFVAVALIGIGAALLGKGVQIGADRVQAQWDAARASDAIAALAQTKRMVQDVDTLAQEFEAESAVLAADLDRARAANIGLRTALAQRASRDSSGPSGVDGGPVGRALAQCADRYSELAGVADGYASQLRGLQAYVRSIAQ